MFAFGRLVPPEVWCQRKSVKRFHVASFQNWSRLKMSQDVIRAFISCYRISICKYHVLNVLAWLTQIPSPVRLSSQQIIWVNNNFNHLIGLYVLEYTYCCFVPNSSLKQSDIRIKNEVALTTREFNCWFETCQGTDLAFTVPSWRLASNVLVPRTKKASHSHAVPSAIVRNSSHNKLSNDNFGLLWW